MIAYSANIEKETINNTNFRKVLYTGKYSQLVVMSLKPGEDIGKEVHDNIDQFFRVESGTGKAIVDEVEHILQPEMVVIVPAGSWHNIINDGNTDLKLYTIYSPPEHADGTVHETKEIADANEHH
jgi:mannose-6-phosphate isomerase-like protein (cupin superfamily)